MTTDRPSPTVPGEKGSLLYFTVISFIAALGGLLFGFDTAVISGAIELLEKQFQLDSIQKGWVVSSALLGCVVGSAIGGWLSDRFGRKRILIVSAVLFGLSAVGCGLAWGPHTLTLFRWLGGVGVGVAAMAAPLYIAEISPAHLRGRMVSFYQFAITIGILVAYFSNALFQEASESARTAQLAPGFWRWILVDEVWRGMLGSLLLPAVAFFALLALVPESPRWLTRRGEDARALEILARVAGRRKAEAEMAEILEALSEERGDMRQLLQPGTRKALSMSVFLAMSAQLSGINAIIYFGPSIFATAGFQFGKALGGQVILGTVNVVFTILAMWKVDTMGRRPLLFVGNLGCFLSLILVGALFATGVTVVSPDQGQLVLADWSKVWLVVFMCGYLACFAFSLGPLPWVFMSEVFPTNIRGRAMSISNLSLWLANTFVIFTFPTLKESIGPAGTFWIYGALVFPVFIFVLRVMPETKGKSLEELERFFRHGSEGTGKTGR